ncbi:MAG: hypothetical protein PHP54_02715 [Clostridia bacterium]|nr:hypothetical protein [Clostridia bacterium]
MKTNKKGISLITLVITIIVVIILAAAVILTLNNNNPIENAKEATFKQDVSTVQDDLNMYVSNKYAKTNGNFDLTALNLSDTTNPKITDELTSVSNSKLNGKVEVQNGKLVYTGTDETEKKWFGEIIQGGTTGGGNTPSMPETTTPPTTAVTENTKYTDASGKTAVIPKGFKVSSIETEQSIDGGLVVIAPDDVGSEFVWVPVSNVDDMIEVSDTTNPTDAKGKLYNWSKGTTYVEGTLNTDTNLREPDYLDNNAYDNNATYLKQINDILATNLTNGEELKALMQEDLNNIYSSVRDNHGFYIGRYETGNLKETKVVSKKDNTDISNQTWYTMYAKQKKYASDISSDSVESNMIFGCQWDATMRFFANDYVVNAETYNGGKSAYFGGSVEKATGSVEPVKNIYDMSGNVGAWTAEANSSSSRSFRGGYYFYSASPRYAAYRVSTNPNGSTSFYGSRLALYIK